MRTKTAPHRKKRDDRIFNGILYVLFTLLMLVCLYPFYYVIINTLSNNAMVERGRVLFYPIGFHLENYREVLQLERLSNAALVSLARVTIGPATAILFSAYTAYVFSKRNMWMHNVWYRIIVVTMYFNAGLIPVYLNIRMLGMLDSFWVYVIPMMLPVYSMVLTKTYIENIPREMEESAQIDGAGYMIRLTRIVLPLCTPVLATVALFQIVNHWNAFMDTLLYVNDYRLYTLQFLLYEYFNQADSLAQFVRDGASVNEEALANMMTSTSVKLTVTVVVVLPIMCVYPALQRFYIKGIMVGAVKG